MFVFFPFFLKKPGIRYFWWGRWSSLNLKFAFPLGRWTLKARHMVIFAENEKVLQGCHRFSMVWQSCWAFFGKRLGGYFICLCSKDFLLGQEHVPSTMHMSEENSAWLISWNSHFTWMWLLQFYEIFPAILAWNIIGPRVWQNAAAQVMRRICFQATKKGN